MASSDLVLNFFPVLFPDLVPVLVRRMEQGEKLLESERRCRAAPGEDEGTYAILVDPAPSAVDRYEEKARSVDDLPEGAVFALMSRALGRRLTEHGYETDDAPVGLCAFKSTQAFGDLAGLIFMRGVELRPDCLIDRRRHRHFGFFISVRVRRRFVTNHTDDPSQLKAAVGEIVRLRSDQYRGNWRLAKFDLARGVAEVASGENSATVALDTLTIPASYNILARYGAMVDRPELASAAMTLERNLGFRYHDSGRLNPAWLAKQRDFVTTWLIEAAQFGRIDFSWRTANLSLSIHPTTLQEF